jgi:hypothetical protein
MVLRFEFLLGETIFWGHFHSKINLTRSLWKHLHYNNNNNNNKKIFEISTITHFGHIINYMANIVIN